MELSTKLKNFIKFAVIKDFVSNMCEVYDDKALKAFNFRLQTSDVLEEAEEFCDLFTNCWMIKKVVLCEGIYVDIPAYVARCDDSTNNLTDYLEYIKKIYSDPSICPEYKFASKHTAIVQNIQKPNLGDTQKSVEDSISGILKDLTPILMNVKQEFQNAELDSYKFSKILLIIVDDIVDTINDSSEKGALKNIIRMFMNLPSPFNIKDINTSLLYLEISKLKSISGYLPMIQSLAVMK